MHYPGERCPSLFLPGPKFISETLPQLPPGPKFITETLPQLPKFITETLPPQPEVFTNTCHPLSITKGPVPPRWQSCPQAPARACPQGPPGGTAVSLLPCRPLVQKCLLLYPEPCDTTRLLPRREVAPRATQTLPVPESPRGDKKRVSRSLPPCAPRCPKPGKLRFPPCGIRSSASCRGECRSHRVAKCPSRCPELISGYSLPLGGVTECPPQPSLGHSSFLRELLAQHRCCKGYPTQECITSYRSEQLLSSSARCDGPAKAAPERRPLKEVAKMPAEVAKTKGSSSAQHLSKTRCPHVRVTPRSSHLSAAKRSGHSKKSRCASKWLW